MLDLVKDNFGAVQGMVGMMLGAILQYMFGIQKGQRIFLLISISTLFTGIAVYNILSTLDGRSLFGFTFEITINSPLVIVAVSFSALISMEIVAISIQLLPARLRKTVMSRLNLEELDHASKNQ